MARRPELTPAIALALARELYEATGERDARLEAVIAQDISKSFKYVAGILGYQRFPVAEPVFAADPSYAYWYVNSVLHGPWPPGERAIVSNEHLAENYLLYYLRSKEDRARFKGLVWAVHGQLRPWFGKP